MKKITVESCCWCPNRGGKASRNSFQYCRILDQGTPKYGIHPDCPLEDDEPSIPISKIRERIESACVELGKISNQYLDNAEGGQLRIEIVIEELESLIGEKEDEK